MRDLQQQEEQIRSALRDKNSQFHLPYKNAFEKLLAHFGLYDAVEHTNHAMIIGEIYRKGKQPHSIVWIAMTMGVSERTLFRYRAKYLKYFYTLLEQELRSENVAITKAEE